MPTTIATTTHHAARTSTSTSTSTSTALPPRTRAAVGPLGTTLALAAGITATALLLTACETTEHPDRSKKTSLKSTGSLPKATFKKGEPLE
jgi:hypothetical protein